MVENSAEKSLWNHVSKYRRFYRPSSMELPRPETIGPWLWLRRKLDKRLTVGPDGKHVPLNSANEFASYAALTEQAYDEAIHEFNRDGQEYFQAWLDRIQSYTEWMSSGDARRARSQSVIASFIGFFVSLTGLYPTRISSLGLDFNGTSKTGFCIFLIFIIAYLAGAYNSMLRDHLILRAALEIRHRIENRYKLYQNRWAKYITLQQVEKSFYERRLPNVLAFFSCVFLLISMIRSWY